VSATSRIQTSNFMQKTPGSCRNRHESLRFYEESAAREAHPSRPAENEGNNQGVTR
jgi:hypothetical protein